MKKVLCFLLAMTMIFSLSGCGDGDEKSKKEDNSGLSSGDAVSEDVKQPKKTEDETIPEQVLLDESGIVITTKGIDKNGLFGPELKLLIENNTEKDLTVQVRSASVNGYMVDTMFSADVAAGKKSNDGISFSNTDLSICGIEAIADVEFSFHIFDFDSWDTYLDTELVVIKTSLADSYVYSFDDSGDEIYNGNGVRIVSKGVSDEDSIFGPSLVVFIENTGEQSITVQVRDVSVNGFMVDTIFSPEISAGKRTVDGITVMSSSMEENSIESIEEIEFSFHIFTTDGWDTIEDTAPIVVKAK